jgi:endogenous inhibitor of DNA gyrase (YacG/DUF329 family)
MQCPICRRVIEGAAAELPFRPFCSERCRSIDLGNWLDASYKVTAPVEDEDLDEGPPTEGEVLSKDPVN